MDARETQSLAVVFLILAVLIIASLFWCLLSTCMGRDVAQSLSELWNFLRISVTGSRVRYRPPFQDEIWEMERRRGPF